MAMMEVQDHAVLPSRFADVSSTPTSSQSQDERWADLVDEAVTSRTVSEHTGEVVTYPSCVRDCESPMAGRKSYDDESGLSTFPTIGSRHHDSGRCKPCAFYHTKGCNSGPACLFCHLCPAYEKQRRKRFARQLCHNLLSPLNAHHPGSKGNVRAKHAFKGGHSRQGSNSSNGTASTCTGWTSDGYEWQHSRQSSTATQASGMPDSNVALNVTPQNSKTPTMFSMSAPEGMLQQVATPLVSMIAVGSTASMVMQSNVQSENDGCNAQMGNIPSHDCAPMPKNSQEQQNLQGAINHYGSRSPCSMERAAQQGRKNLNLAAAIPAEAPTMSNLSSPHGVQMPMSLAQTCGTQEIAAPVPQLMTPNSAVEPKLATGFVTCGGVQYALVPIAQPYNLAGAYPAQMPEMQMATSNYLPSSPYYQCSNSYIVAQIYEHEQGPCIFHEF